MTNLELDRRIEVGENDDGEFLSHEIAVESREADRTRLSVGDTTARTWNVKHVFMRDPGSVR